MNSRHENWKDYSLSVCASNARQHLAQTYGRTDWLEGLERHIGYGQKSVYLGVPSVLPNAVPFLSGLCVTHTGPHLTLTETQRTGERKRLADKQSADLLEPSPPYIRVYTQAQDYKYARKRSCHHRQSSEVDRNTKIPCTHPSKTECDCLTGGDKIKQVA